MNARLLRSPILSALIAAAAALAATVIANNNNRAGWKVVAYDRFLSSSWPCQCDDEASIQAQRSRVASLTLLGGDEVQKLAVEYDRLLVELEKHYARVLDAASRRIQESAETRRIRKEANDLYVRLRNAMSAELN